jgi:hypothetical protein
MKNTIKSLFGILTSFALISSVNAGEVTVTGTAKATYSKVSGYNTSVPSIGIQNELAFNASGELDNGYTWVWQIESDPDAGSTSAFQNDDSRMEITMGDMGKLGLYVSEGSISSKYAWDASAYTSITDTGLGEGITYPANLSSYNNVQYTTPTLPYSTTLTVGYGNNPSQEAASANASGTGERTANMTSYRIKTSPVDGLAISATYSDVEEPTKTTNASSDRQEEENGSIGAMYKTGGFTVGYGKSWKANTLSSTDYAGATSIEYVENRGMSIAYAINDAMTVSLTDETSENNYGTSTTVSYDIDVSSIQLAYNMGGATLSLARTETDNQGYVQNKDVGETLIAIAMAF